MFWIYFGSLERDEGKKISNGGMKGRRGVPGRARDGKEWQAGGAVERTLG